jgi:transposase
MIAADQEARVLRLYHAEKWRVHTIARQLGLHHMTVRRVLARSGIAATDQRRWPSKLDPYLPFLQATLAEYSLLTAARLYEMVRQRGYAGGPDHFRHLVAQHRPRRPAEAYLRLRTLPGEQGQVDWAHFGKLQIAGAWRPLLGFVMVLSWSRRIFLRFFLNARMENFLRGHQAAFLAWQGCPRVLLYDNLKSAVLERHGNAVRLHPTLLALAAHYGFEPRPVAVGRGNEKGRVERAIQYVRRAFFDGRLVTDLDQLNAEAAQWCAGLSADRRCPEDHTLSVAEAFAQERQALLSLPVNEFPTDERLPVAIGKTPYARFDGNDYSVPHTCVRRTLVVLADLETVRLLDGAELVASHRRSYGRGEQIEAAEHIAALVADKRHAAEHRRLDRLRRVVPKSQQLLAVLAQRGDRLGAATATLLRLLDLYGAAALDRAVAEALAHDSPHPQTVRLILERHRQNSPHLPSLPLPLRDDPRRLGDLVVRPHNLGSYDVLIDHPAAADDDNTDR